MKVSIVCSFVLLLATGAVSAGAAAQDPQAASAQPSAGADGSAGKVLEGVKDPDEVRCKRMPVTGSRVGKMICHTNAEWAAMEKGAKQFMQDVTGTPTGSPFGEGGGIRTPTPIGDGL